MPYAATFFACFGDCQAFCSSDLRADDLVDVDALLVRSTVQVNEQLLKQAQKLSFVGTATAGTNHVDQGYLAHRHIPFYSAAGCNAIAVAEYVLSAIFVMAKRKKWRLTEKTVGIVGAGHVGTALSQKLAALGIHYYLCDPPLAATGDPRDFVDFEHIFNADIISLHTPLIGSGPYPTKHLFNRERFARFKRRTAID